MDCTGRTPPYIVPGFTLDEFAKPAGEHRVRPRLNIPREFQHEASTPLTSAKCLDRIRARLCA